MFHSSSSRRTRLRVGALICCLSTALAAELIWKHIDARPGPLSITPAQPSTESPEQILAAIPAPAGNSETNKALVAALAKVRKTPSAAVAWVNLGDALAQVLRESADLNYYGLAERAYGHALQLNSRSADAMTGMAWVTGGRHLFEQSIEWANRALALDPGNVAAHGIIGDAALELGDYDKAFSEYQKMMDLRPDLSSWSRGAYLLWVTGNQSKAMWLMQKAIKAGAPYAENTAWCRAKLAMMLFQDGAFVPAAQALTPALTAAPHNIHVLLAAGRIAAARHDFTGAKKYYQTVLETGPNHEALVALGDLHALNGEKVEAEKYYVQVEALHAAHLVSGVHDHMLMAKFYADHDRNLVEALRLAEQRKLTRNVLEADILAWVYFKNGDLAHGRDAIERALRRNTPDAEMRYHAGMIAAACGDRVSAKKYLGEAISFNPQFSLLQAPIAFRTLDRLAAQTATTILPAKVASAP